MLGELYRPSGLAYETAKAVLETEEIYACNVALGCSNNCAYCYVPRFTRRCRDACDVRLPKKPPVDLVRHQLEHSWRFHWTSKLGVFLSFLTDPFLPQIKKSTEQLIEHLLDQGVTVATLSKLDASAFYVKHGMTFVSLDDAFHDKFEPLTMSPKSRIEILELCKGKWHEQVWVSIEPYPPSAIYKQRIEELLEELNFVDLIVFGRWRYDARASTKDAKLEYANYVQTVEDFCKENHIRCHIKNDTRRFIEDAYNKNRETRERG